MTESSKNNGGKAVIKLDDAVWFLEQVWTYASNSANCYAVVAIDGGVEYEHFCLSELENYGKLLRAVRRYLSGIEAGKHVYYQVLPLAAKPAKGRGSERDVKVGKWLWIDLDYKEVVDKPEFDGCRELGDHALECYYREEDKWVHVTRPPLSQVLSKVKDLGLEPWFVVDSGAGYHLYFKLSYEVDTNTLKKLEAWLVEKLGGDPQAKDLARILRLPGSVNPRTRRLVQVVYQGSEEIDSEQLLQRIKSEREERRHEEQASVERKRKPQKLRELTDTEVLKIVDLLKEAYRPGFRQFICLYLSGWLAKAEVSPLSAVKIIKHLYDSSEDKDLLKTRLSAVVYSYKKAGIDVDAYASEIEELTGVKPYGLEREIDEENVKGRSGLQEVLEQALGEERALTVIHEISEILQSSSPYRDAITLLLDYSKRMYAVADLRKKLMLTAQRDEAGKLVYKTIVAYAVPTRIILYLNPITGTRTYEVTFEGEGLTEPLTCGPGTMDDVTLCIKALTSVIVKERLFNDVLNAIVTAYILKGRAEVRRTVENPGFYFIENKIVPVNIELWRIDKGKLKEALLLLNELAEVWFAHAKEKFVTVIKWGAVAPFSYAIKQKHKSSKWVRWLYIYGETDTGKSTLGLLVLRMWNAPEENLRAGTAIDTIPKLGEEVSKNTLPKLVIEPRGIFDKPELVEAIKIAIETLIARTKFVGGRYRLYPSLNPLIITSNYPPPPDDSLLKRLIVLHFSYSEKVPHEKQDKFRAEVEPRLELLKEVGNCIAHLVLENPSWLDLYDMRSLDLGRMLLEKCYEASGLEKPSWLNLEYSEFSASATEMVIEEFAERLKRYINDLFARYVSRVVEVDSESLSSRMIEPDRISVERKIRVLLREGMIPGMRIKPGDEDHCYILYSLIKEIELSETVDLKSLSEMLGWEYGTYKIHGKPVKAVRVKIEDLVKLLTE